MSAVVRFACVSAKTFIRILPAGRVRVLGWLGGGQKSRAWRGAKRPVRIFWDSDLKAWIEVDLRDWSGRWHYFSGRYHDQALPWIMRKVLRNGDLFVDVGANVGMHSLRAARLVGSDGRVESVEPGSSALERLRLHLAMNRISNVRVHSCAAGSKAGEASLRADPDHSGTASLRDGPSVGTAIFPVSVRPLDSFIDLPAPGVRVFVKIDVEGFELEVIKGATGFLHRPDTTFVLEVTPEWIEATGGRAADLFYIFKEAGYQSFAISRKRRWYREEAKLSPVEMPGPKQADYLFVRRHEAPWSELLVSR